MAVTWTAATLNAQADEDAARCAYGSLHTGNPSTTGANEATGGSPAYARQALAFEAAGDEGPLGASLQPATDGVAWASATFDLPSGTFSHYGYWSASTSGTFRGGGALSTSVVMSADGEQVVSFRVGPNA